MEKLIEKYLVKENASENRFSKILKKYLSDIEKIKKETLKQAKLLINQVQDEKTLDGLYDLLDENDEVQSIMASMINAKIDGRDIK